MREPGRLAAEALALWVAGALIVLLWSALGHMALALIARDADPLDARRARAAAVRRPTPARAGRACGLSLRVGAPLMWAGRAR